MNRMRIQAITYHQQYICIYIKDKARSTVEASATNQLHELAGNENSRERILVRKEVPGNESSRANLLWRANFPGSENSRE